ncbi:olfactory receptor 6N1-like [Erpetoichthys calabaricus]|uniref:olfactory receptor 6N1-like n=1 Tax=Erpetoichthys calabaricus TaxID=27687 RepID=UPI00223445AA|nr:olfactory receptor 6N1-like [Erpetoichthys calabaricus]
MSCDCYQTIMRHSHVDNKDTHAECTVVYLLSCQAQTKTFHLSTEFILVGFPGLENQESKIILSGVFLTIYLLILLGNLLIILIFAKDKSLRMPMYILICSLAFLDLIVASITIPKMIAIFMIDNRSISFAACFAQLLFHHGLVTAESFLLGLMAYDRYLAICHPLHYCNIMTNLGACKLIVCCWIGGFLGPTIPLILALRLPFCGPNKVIHCFCDHVSVIRLACAETVVNNYVALSISLCSLFFPLLYILYSYVRIVRSVLKIARSEECVKTFSTCITHIVVISVFFLTAASIYISYRIPGTSADLRIMAALIQNMFPPLMNPMIYCLRTKEIRESILRILRRNQIFIA